MARGTQQEGVVLPHRSPDGVQALAELNALADRLRGAVPDLVWLLDRGYPHTASVTIVGDRYRCTREERSMLYRGVCTTASARSRSDRRVDFAAVRDSFWIDAYNAVLLLYSYRKGRPTFVSIDGFVRDVGGVHGAVRDERVFYEELGALVSFVAQRSVSAVYVFDSPVSHSRDHGRFVEEHAAAQSSPVRVVVEQSADAYLARSATGTVATADSALIDRTSGAVCDVAAALLVSRYAAEPLDLRSFLGAQNSAWYNSAGR